MPKILCKWRGAFGVTFAYVHKNCIFFKMEKQKKISNPVKGENESHLHIYRLDLTTVPGPQPMRSEPMDGGPGDPGHTSQLMLIGSGQLR